MSLKAFWLVLCLVICPAVRAESEVTVHELMESVELEATIPNDSSAAVDGCGLYREELACRGAVNCAWDPEVRRCVFNIGAH